MLLPCRYWKPSFYLKIDYPVYCCILLKGYSLINVIFVSYYTGYLEKALDEIIYICSGIEEDVRLIIVDNGKQSIDPSITNKYTELVDVNIISGSNDLWEFSAWREGFESIDKCSEDDYYIFANDTFCHHRIWGILERYCFRKSFYKHILNNSKGITGNVNTFGSCYSIDGVESRYWVSTYLFGIDGVTFYKFKDDLFLDKNQLQELVYSNNDDIIFTKLISQSLVGHINQWMFPGHESKGWYKSSQVNTEVALRKIWAILNEKHFSAILNSNERKLFHYIPQRLKLLMRIRFKVQKFIQSRMSKS